MLKPYVVRITSSIAVVADDAKYAQDIASKCFRDDHGGLDISVEEVTPENIKNFKPEILDALPWGSAINDDRPLKGYVK